MSRLIDLSTLFDDPLTLPLLAVVGGTTLFGYGLFFALLAAGRIRGAHRADVVARATAWVMVIPGLTILAVVGGIYTGLLTGLLAVACYREFGRVTGIWTDRPASIVVLGSIALSTFAVVNHSPMLLAAVVPLGIAAAAAAEVARDRPTDFTRRLGLCAFSVAFFAGAFPHLGLFALDGMGRPLLLWLLLSLVMNDILAFAVGRWLGRRPLIPRTSPKKTVEGSVGAMLLVGLGAAFLARPIFAGTPLEHPGHLFAMGLLLSLSGQFGDLVFSSVKRDLGHKDFGTLLPGQGGLLDRFDSTIVAAPVLYYYIAAFRGVATDVPINVWIGL